MEPDFTDTVPGHLQAIHQRVKVVENETKAQSLILAKQSDQLAELLETTRTIKDLQATGRVATTALKWLGSVSAGGLIIYHFFFPNGFHWPGK